jgi:capsular polysaccharide biosynthesis protein
LTSPGTKLAFRKASLAQLAARQESLESCHALSHVTSLAAETVQVPQLRFGATFLEQWRVREEPHGVSWREQHYLSFSPAVFALKHACVHSSAGIVLAGDVVIADSLEHTSPERHHYTLAGRGIALERFDAAPVTGTCISALAGASRNYFHAIADCIGRLSAIPADLLGQADSILVPAESPAVAEILRLWRSDIRLRPVAHGETLRVENLILPTTIHGQACYHSCFLRFLDSATAQAAAPPTQAALKRIYLDRSGVRARKLVNEDDLVTALAELGVVPIKPETLSIAEQIALFRHADLIVAPHGAGLANLAYAGRDCVVLELLMDAYANWSFRRLAAARGLRYDCVIGRAIGAWPPASPAIHGTRWTISIPHVIAAVGALTDP